ncbi:MAG: crossover junction endodeoxyribonuclease RuvC [Candidatus Margulisbacteria bacterium]|nr:crossover junction endodeoxyribonuclease RuvC [Candidatus Margulisiibacteriota bacterium]
MRIIGIDPGYALVGYGIIDVVGNTLKPVKYGCIKTEAKTNFYSRMIKINTELKELLKEFNPTAMGIEKLFFSRNTTTALDVAQVRGAIIQEGLNCGLEIYEYTPNEVKIAVTGYGKADKQQIQQMVKNLLHLTEIPKPDDTADALAIAICHNNSYRIKGLERINV